MSARSEGNSEGAPKMAAPSHEVNSNESNANELQDWGGRSRTYNRRINSAMLCH
jgi:hypothetical protein